MILGVGIFTWNLGEDFQLDRFFVELYKVLHNEGTYNELVVYWRRGEGDLNLFSELKKF